MEKFWNFIKNESDNTAELLLYGTISDNSWWSDSVSPKRFKEDLEKLGNVTQITVRIYSGGGDVFAANAIYSMLKDHKAEIIVKIDGLAASAATIIAMSGDKILIPENGYIMIHKVSTYISGNIDDIQKELELLEKIENTLVQTYVKRTGKTKEEVQALIDAETWLTGREAVEEGFADELMFENEEEKEKISNGILNKIEVRNDLEKCKNLPENLKNNMAKLPSNVAEESMPITLINSITQDIPDFHFEQNTASKTLEGIDVQKEKESTSKVRVDCSNLDKSEDFESNDSSFIKPSERIVKSGKEERE